MTSGYDYMGAPIPIADPNSSALRSDPRFSRWAKTGAGTVFATYGDGNPGRPLDLPVGTVTPTALGIVLARCQNFSFPLKMQITGGIVFGRNVTTGLYNLALYENKINGNKVWDSGAFDTVGNDFIDLSAVGTPALNTVILAALTPYILALAANQSGASAGIEIYGQNASKGMTTHGFLEGLLIGLPLQYTIPVAAGAFPSTLPALSQPGANTTAGPVMWLQGITA